MGVYWDNHILVIFILKYTLYESHQLLRSFFLQKIYFLPCAHFQYGRNFVESVQKKFPKNKQKRLCDCIQSLDVIKRCRGGKRKNAIFVRIEFNLNVFIGFRLFCLYVVFLFFRYLVLINCLLLQANIASCFFGNRNVERYETNKINSK